MVADWLMVGSRTSAIREIPSVQGIKLNLRLHRIRPGQTPTFAIIPSTAGAGDIQADDTKDSDLFGDPPLKPSTKPPSDRVGVKNEWIERVIEHPESEKI